MIPASDQLEITLIGPGYGESAVIHIGNGDWVIVDSCANACTGRPLPLEYLETLGVPPSSVRMVIISHWHDDHIRGISEILESCVNATIACPTAIGEKEVRAFIRAQTLLRTQATTSGTDEYAAALDVIKKRAKNNRVCFGQATSLLLSKGQANLWNCEIWSLSPSSAEYARFMSSLGRLMPRASGQMKRLPAPEPNDLAMAVWAKIVVPGKAEVNLLCGSDLEETANPSTGWSAVLSSTTRPHGVASVFKVAHHGSVSGHHDGVWSTMLTNPPWAILTPFQQGSQMLPTATDLRRIYAKTPHAYISSDPTVRQSRKRTNRLVDKTLKGLGVTLKPAQLPPGRVTMRNGGLGKLDDWTVTLGGAARSVEQIIRGLAANSGS